MSDAPNRLGLGIPSQDGGPGVDNPHVSFPGLHPMSVEPEEWLILGITRSSEKFRPSDWPDRLCGALAAFDEDHRLTYSRHARPVTRHGQAGVVVETILQDINPEAYEFLMGFARENDLRVEPGRGKIRLGRDESVDV